MQPNGRDRPFRDPCLTYPSGGGSCRAMRVVVDLELCEGNAVCASVAPEIFVVGDDDLARVKLEPVPEALRAKVEVAVRRCPRQALAIKE